VDCTLVVTDFFVVGLALDATGAWLLVRGLLPTPVARFDLSFGHSESVSKMRDKIDATFGLAALLLGFALQGIGYIVALAYETDSATGAEQALTAAVLAGATSALFLAAYFRLREPKLRRMIVRTVLAANEGRWTTQSAASLLSLGQEAGYPVSEDDTKHSYARRVFGVELPPDVH
jgi:hypothetical protein